MILCNQRSRTSTGNQSFNVNAYIDRSIPRKHSKRRLVRKRTTLLKNCSEDAAKANVLYEKVSRDQGVTQLTMLATQNIEIIIDNNKLY